MFNPKIKEGPNHFEPMDGLDFVPWLDNYIANLRK
jgi:hypothetical protein